MKQLLTLFFFLPFSTLFAQKKEGFLNTSFKPTDNTGRYYAITEKRDDRWYREAYYMPEKSLAMTGWYKDEDCKILHGEAMWYYPNKNMQSRINYAEGKENGLSLSYHQNGMLRDSSHYSAGRRKGISLGWNDEGYQVDSTNFDGVGNGVQIRWYPGGHVFSAGRFTNDTMKVKRWKYYHPNGKTLANEDYINGERTSCSCFDENEKQLDSLVCAREEEAKFPGEENSWRRFLERNLNPEVPVKNRAPEGMYTVIVSFVVNSNGQLADIKATTNFGYGMEQEVVRLLKKSPNWVPAFQFGRNVKAYRLQPVTFVVTKD